ncbi:MAG TPA: hypothetical protein VK515_08430 [Rhizomicrobium sp.]|nr:hypothetical protein [Rhizomicrobium sp.]
MFNTKILLAAASLAVLSAAGLGSASAAPWDHGRDHNRVERHDNFHHDGFRRDLAPRRAFVDRVRLTQALRFHRYRVIGEPTFIHDRYVVRTHDRFGRIVFVQVDPYSGAFIREVRL